MWMTGSKSTVLRNTGEPRQSASSPQPTRSLVVCFEKPAAFLRSCVYLILYAAGSGRADEPFPSRLSQKKTIRPKDVVEMAAAAR